MHRMGPNLFASTESQLTGGINIRPVPNAEGAPMPKELADESDLRLHWAAERRTPNVERRTLNAER
jgi:hypothetical protein